jgi:hypothetical protein
MEEDEHGRNSAHYLETFSDRNVGFYRRRGHVVGEFTIGDGTRGWGMVRPAGLTAAS